MNPDKNYKRGCFIRKEENETFTVVDYPTWSFKKYGLYTARQNEPLPESVPFEQNFQTKEDAVKFCENENMVVCAGPNSKPVEVVVDDDAELDY